MKTLTRHIIALTCTAILFFSSSCVKSSGDSQVSIVSNIITGSYNNGITDCEFTSEKTFDGEGNIAGCKFSNQCSGSSQTTEFVNIGDDDFFSKCIAPEEELATEPPAIEEAPSESGIGTL